MIKEKVKNISGVILAGGENKRFGGINKSNLIIGGSSIMSRIIDAISDIFEEIIIVTNNPEEFHSFSHYKIVTDQFTKVGPLGGLHSAIKTSSKESVFVFAGDMPFVDKAIIINQIEYFSLCTAEAVIPRVNGYDEPLHAIYRNSIYGLLDNYLATRKEYAIRDFLVNVHVNYLQLSVSEQTVKAFTNINTPFEADKATRLSGI
jgi:molybdopterin-guanine dinucleotide biosynthesis protein A